MSNAKIQHQKNGLFFYFLFTWNRPISWNDGKGLDCSSNFLGLSESYTVPFFPLSFHAWFLVVRGTSAEAPGQGRQGQACACCAAYPGCRARFPGRVQGSHLKKLRVCAFLKTSTFMHSQKQKLSLIWRHTKTTDFSPCAICTIFFHGFPFLFPIPAPSPSPPTPHHTSFFF